MLKKDEREAVIKFLGYFSRRFYSVCREHGVQSARIIKKLENHKAELNKYRATPLTIAEQAVLSGFLRENIAEFRAWLTTYELNEDHLFRTFKRMVH